MQWIYYLLFAIWYALSHLPLGVLYWVSDYIIYPLVYYVGRYRRGLVEKQLSDCFPEETKEWRKKTERDFYHYFCDYIVETVKMMSMSRTEMKRRVEWVGLDNLEEEANRAGKQFVFGYLGHFGNWEWLSSFPLYLKDFYGAQIYHPLRNMWFDELFRRMRQQYGGICIPMKETFRDIIKARRHGQKFIIGFIADQCPKWEAMHEWTDFLHHKTSFFIGTEKIGKQVDAAIIYIDVSRPRRGYYRAEVRLITTDAKSWPDFKLTDEYARLLEASIRRNPHLWLWTHNRWKRTYEEWERMQRVDLH